MVVLLFDDTDKYSSVNIILLYFVRFVLFVNVGALMCPLLTGR